jgi:hypothetical protein
MPHHRFESSFFHGRDRPLSLDQGPTCCGATGHQAQIAKPEPARSSSARNNGIRSAVRDAATAYRTKLTSLPAPGRRCPSIHKNPLPGVSEGRLRQYRLAAATPATGGSVEPARNGTAAAGAPAVVSEFVAAGGVLQEDHRIVVGHGDAAAAEPLRSLRNGLGCRRRGEPINLPGLGDVPVLAEPARQIAARRAEGQHGAGRQEVVERLFSFSSPCRSRRRGSELGS